MTSGTKGGYLWIWDSTSIQEQLGGGPDAEPLGCLDNKTAGPCNLLDVFPQTLTDSVSGVVLGDLEGFGRLHGVIKDPQNKYVNANFFAPGGGFVGIIDTDTKEAVALFRVTSFEYEYSSTKKVNRSVHMSFWTADGLGIIISNLHGKAIERIDIARDSNGKITGAVFNKSASVGLGSNMSVEAEASYFEGNNAFGRSLLGGTKGDYEDADLGDLTPNGLCKENDCSASPTLISQAGGRSNNVPICPIPTKNDNIYVTLGGGGLLVLDSSSAPMKIVGEYGKNVVYGAGCGGVEVVGNQVFLNGGVSASGAGATQSTFAVLSFDDTKYNRDGVNPENHPMPERIYQDKTNTRTIGNTEGGSETNESGQIPGTTTRRDSHGMDVTIDGKYLHVVDRIQNIIETFDTKTFERDTYDLVSKDGKGGREAPAGPCFAKSVLDSDGLTLNDPTPDLMEVTPDGKHIMVAFRGPAPISVAHAGQGSCPGVGIVEITEGGKSGKLVAVLRTTNRLDVSVINTIVGGHDYDGVERSDVHGVIVIPKH